ncbi:MAG: hypothetical protein M3418_01915 [Gemmatimonadota bacterium]|nr:hypothetical protein [Gemmatimonadota bacterium]
MRIEAVEIVAAHFGVRQQTVQDIFVRRLRPRAKNTDEADRFIQDWLRTGSDDLRKAALDASCDRRDEEAIASFFNRYRPASAG